MRQSSHAGKHRRRMFRESLVKAVPCTIRRRETEEKEKSKELENLKKIGNLKIQADREELLLGHS